MADFQQQPKQQPRQQPYYKKPPINQVKITPLMKRKRVNYRLRKLIVPKSPMVVLNEMVGAVHYDFVDNPPMPYIEHIVPNLFTAQCLFEGKAFTGTGPTKQIAKNICAEHVIQHVVSQRCVDSKVKARQMLTEQGGAVPEHERTEETPWAQLASLALFKMFNDWQAQGYDIPPEILRTPDYFNNQGSALPAQGQKPQEPKAQQAQSESPSKERDPPSIAADAAAKASSSASTSETASISDPPTPSGPVSAASGWAAIKGTEPPTDPTSSDPIKALGLNANTPFTAPLNLFSAQTRPREKPLPANATLFHPLQLMHEMRPELTVRLVSEEGQSPNTSFVFGVDVDGRTIVGRGKNKKDAKRACAATVMNELFGTDYNI